MDSVCIQIISIASRESGTRPKIPGTEDIQIPPMVPSNILKGVADSFAEEAKEVVLGLTFNKEMREDSIASFKTGSTEIFKEDMIGRSDMYSGKLRANLHFNHAVEKFSEHIQDSSSLDALIHCSLKCEFITCDILDFFIGGFLRQPRNFVAFLKDVKQQLSPLRKQI